MQLDAFENLVKSINDFWLTKVKLPTGTAIDRSATSMPEQADRLPPQVLLVEDSPGDVRLTPEAFKDANTSITLHVTSTASTAWRSSGARRRTSTRLARI